MRQSSPSIVEINHGPFVCFGFFIFLTVQIGPLDCAPIDGPALEAAEGNSRHFPKGCDFVFLQIIKPQGGLRAG
jgi:hypothetical protein